LDSLEVNSEEEGEYQMDNKDDDNVLMASSDTSKNIITVKPIEKDHVRILPSLQ
jgi:urate oxidase